MLSSSARALRHELSRPFTSASSRRSQTTQTKTSTPLLILLIGLPTAAFALGTWQVQRRRWKLALIEDATKKLDRPPIRELGQIKVALEDEISGGDSIPVLLTGVFDHAQEMLVGPRQYQGRTGYHVVSPLRLEQGGSVLVNRGWIDKAHESQRNRPSSLPSGRVDVLGLLKRRPAHNMFTPENDAAQGKYYYIDLPDMSRASQTEPILVEETRDDSYRTDDLEKRGVPIGRPHAVLLVNNHMQYIITW